MNVLALDPGTSMGWARHIPPGVVEAGREDWKVKKGDAPGLRWAKFRSWLLWNAFTTNEIDLLVVEAPLVHGRMKSMAANRSAYGWNAIAEEVAASYGINYLEVANNTIKKFATGNGRAEKEQVFAVAFRRWPHLFPGDEKIENMFDVADALWLLQYAREEVVISGP